MLIQKGYCYTISLLNKDHVLISELSPNCLTSHHGLLSVTLRSFNFDTAQKLCEFPCENMKCDKYD
jgi:hypothetical protein